MTNQDVLSFRYATPEMNAIFSERGKIIAERKLWIAVMRAQRELGIDIPLEEIKKFEAVVENVDLNRIEELERESRHDVNARIKAFIEIAGAREYIHRGMTSRDLTDNVEQMQIKAAVSLILGKAVSVARHLGEKADKYRHIELTSRTHHQPAQLTLLGRRLSMTAEELVYGVQRLEEFLAAYPLRGIKGPVGTQADMLKYLGSNERVQALEKAVAAHLGFSTVLESPGQIYPRSLDFDLASRLLLIGAAYSNFGLNMRLMSGYELATEGFKAGQVGSSAMPHKMNTRTSERINGMMKILRMNTFGLSELAGEQWEEGDVSDSSPRRVMIPALFYTIDGMTEATLTVLNEMGVYEAIISQEVDRYLPFLATTQILAEVVRQGAGREEAHAVIKRYAVGEALRMRDEGSEPKLAQRLAEDPLFSANGITVETIQGILQNKSVFLGNAYQQIDAVLGKIEGLCQRYENEARYEPRDIK